jgi:hypothetical protein
VANSIEEGLDSRNATAASSTPSRRRLLDIMWQYHSKHKHRAVPKYKEKVVRPAVNDWHRNFYFNTPASRHRRRRSAAYVALTAKDFDPVVRHNITMNTTINRLADRQTSRNYDKGKHNSERCYKQFDVIIHPRELRERTTRGQQLTSLRVFRVLPSSFSSSFSPLNNKVRALGRYSSEMGMEVATAQQLRSGDQREHSKQVKEGGGERGGGGV